VRVGSAALLAGVAAAGCGGRSPAAHISTAPALGWSPAACASQSSSIANEALRLVHTYQPGFGVGSTADVAYFELRTVLGGFQRHHCAAKLLGRTIDQRLTHRQQLELFSHLPRAMTAYFRKAVAVSRG
jgi:hypothetical protein